jgi:hypothetical protein
MLQLEMVMTGSSVLLQANADADSQTNDGWTAVQLSAWHGHEKVLQIFAAHSEPTASSDDTEDLLSLLEHFARGDPTNSLMRRAVGNEYLRRGMVAQARQNYDASVEILLQKRATTRIESLEIEGVYCDGCRKQILGAHFKCAECDWNIDVCALCVGRDGHDHQLIRIPSRVGNP